MEGIRGICIRIFYAGRERSLQVMFRVNYELIPLLVDTGSDVSTITLRQV